MTFKLKEVSESRFYSYIAHHRLVGRGSVVGHNTPKYITLTYNACGVEEGYEAVRTCWNGLCTFQIKLEEGYR